MNRHIAVRLLATSLAAVLTVTAASACSIEQPTTLADTTTTATASPSITQAPVAPTAVAAPATTTKATPRPTTATKKRAKTTSVYRCEPKANAKFEDPARPNVITNKSCPALNAAKEKAQREYAEQQKAAQQLSVGEAALKACREQTGQTTQQCQAQAARGEAS